MSIDKRNNKFNWFVSIYRQKKLNMAHDTHTTIILHTC